MEKNINLGLLIIRVIIAFPMFIYGISKCVNGVEFIEQMLADKGLPSILAYGVYIGELIAPLLIIIGFKTRLASAVFAFNCLTAILLANTSAIFALNQYGGWQLELLAIYMFVSLGLVFTGPGKFAYDEFESEVEGRNLFDNWSRNN